MTMDVTAALGWLDHRTFAVYISQSAMLFPLLEIFHVAALSLVVGSIALIDARLLGWGDRRGRISDLILWILPWTWTAFAITFVAGALMFCSRATKYYQNIPFRIKMLCLGLAGINMLFFHLFTARDIAQWDRGTPPPSAKCAGALSLLLWVGVVAGGRWVGFSLQ